MVFLIMSVQTPVRWTQFLLRRFYYIGGSTSIKKASTVGGFLALFSVSSFTR
jgi:hypothetical protein